MKVAFGSHTGIKSEAIMIREGTRAFLGLRGCSFVSAPF